MALDPRLALINLQPPGPRPLLPNELEQQQLGLQANRLGLRALQRQDTAGEMDLQEKQRQQKEAEAIRDALSTSSSTEEALTKIERINPTTAAAFRQKLADAQKQGLENTKLQHENAAKQLDAIGAAAQAAKGKGQGAWIMQLQQLEGSGFDVSKLPTKVTDDDLDQLSKASMSAKDQLAQQLNVEKEQREKATQAETGRHNLATETATTAQHIETERHNLQTEQGLAAQRAETDRHNRAMEVNAKLRIANQTKEGESVVDLTGDALDMAARRYLQDGTLPPMGMSKAAAGSRTRIINRAAELDPTAAIAANAAEYKANRDSLTQVTKSLNSIEAFEKTARANLQQFIETARKVRDTGSPWLNRALRNVDRNVLGSTDQAAYDAARRVAITEIARITANPNLTGTLSDSARHEVESFSSDNATLAQTLRVSEVLLRDMDNRVGPLREQQKHLQELLRQKPGATPPPAAGAPKNPYR